MAGKIDARLKELGLTLPSAPVAVANYVPFVKSGSLVFVSGQLPLQDGALKHTGLVGAGVTLEQAVEAARVCGLNLIAQVKAACQGDLDQVTRVVQLTGFVAAAADFADHPTVINGASDLMVQIFGEAGRHSRAAVGASSLPRKAPVEIAAVFALA